MSRVRRVRVELGLEILVEIARQRFMSLSRGVLNKKIQEKALHRAIDIVADFEEELLVFGLAFF